MLRLGKKTNNVNVKVDDEEEEIVEKVADTLHNGNKSEALRDAIRLIRVLFHPDMTLNKLIEEEFIDMVVENKKFREDVPLKNIMKNVPELENEVITSR